MNDNKQLREVLLQNGLFQTVNGDYVSASLIGLIIPNRKAGTAVCKDKNGNRIAILCWPKDG